MRPAPLARGFQIHESHALYHPVEQQGAGRLAAVVGGRQDDAIAGERLMTVREHEERLRVMEQPFFIDVQW